MRRYSLKHEYAVTEEDGKPIKQCNIQIYLCEHGIEKKQIMELLTGVTESYNRFLEGEAGEQNSLKRGWFIHG